MTWLKRFAKKHKLALKVVITALAVIGAGAVLGAIGFAVIEIHDLEHLVILTWTLLSGGR
ncbi:hypothetical protein [Bifidobacterium sp. ESL0790]|uniref:hypothetical protein n=1 Tax=Bifidobacterium sp. ESL0790 TaxID=2983233 RepID=UPI0023F6AED3|nr:hypothetical protein [Bifidobacterium sp. ESL0790]WEV72162.1 hypothetical protein OZY47_06895 [Bifidobacterium sp. ESL0790]